MKKLHIVLLTLFLNSNLGYGCHVYSLPRAAKLTIFLGKIKKLKDVILGQEFIECKVNKNKADYTYVTFSIDNKTYKPGKFLVSIFFDKKIFQFWLEV